MFLFFLSVRFQDWENGGGGDEVGFADDAEGEETARADKERNAGDPFQFEFEPMVGGGVAVNGTPRPAYLLKLTAPIDLSAQDGVGADFSI